MKSNVAFCYIGEKSRHKCVGFFNKILGIPFRKYIF